jgi:hypothetical protein
LGISASLGGIDDLDRASWRRIRFRIHVPFAGDIVLSASPDRLTHQSFVAEATAIS